MTVSCCGLFPLPIAYTFLLVKTDALSVWSLQQSAHCLKSLSFTYNKMYSSVGGQPTTTMKFLKELDLSLSFLLPQQKHISSHNTKRQGWRGGGGRSEEENQKGIPNSQSCPECCTTNDLERESECVCVCYVVCVYEEKSDRSTPLVLSREKMTVVAMKILSELNLPLFPSPAILQQLSLSLETKEAKK